MYRLDRQAFSIQTFETADNHRAYWLSKSPRERLEAAWYLICSAWNLDPASPTTMDRSQFSIRKHSEDATKHL